MRQLNRRAAAAVWLVLAFSATGFTQPPADAPPTSTLPLRLTGVMLDQNAPAKSACLIHCLMPPERTGLFYVGQTACDLAEIREVRADGIVIENTIARRIEVLRFRPDERATATSEAAPEAVGSGPSGGRERPPALTSRADSDIVSINLTRSAVEGYLSNLPDLLDSALTKPHFTETIGGQRRIEGYEIDNIRENSPIQQWGFQDGDVVLDVDGEPLDGMATVMRLFGRIQNASQTRLTVVRQGRKLRFVFNVK